MGNKKLRNSEFKEALNNSKRWKLLGIIAIMILIGLTIASSAEALKFDLDKIFKGKWFIGIVNSLIVFVIVFILIYVLNPEKEAKVKAAPIILALVIAAIAGFTLSSNFIWNLNVIKDFIHLKVIVNLVIVMTILFILQGIIIRDKIALKEAKIAVGLLMLIIAIAVVKPAAPYSDETYRYVWQWPIGAQIKFFLLGLHDQTEPLPDGTKATARWYTSDELDIALGIKKAEQTEGVKTLEELQREQVRTLEELQRQGTQQKTMPRGDVRYGVLTGTAVWSWLIGTIVIGMIFTLILNIQGPKWIYWILSGLIAMTTANAGGGSMQKWLIILGQFVVGILFFRAFGGAAGANWVKNGIALVMAYLLTSYIFALAFPCHTIPHFNPFKTLTGTKCPDQIQPAVKDAAVEYPLSAEEREMKRALEMEHETSPTEFREEFMELEQRRRGR